jgi:hypothetical protein
MILIEGAILGLLTGLLGIGGLKAWQWWQRSLLRARTAGAEEVREAAAQRARRLNAELLKDDAARARVLEDTRQAAQRALAERLARPPTEAEVKALIDGSLEP